MTDANRDALLSLQGSLQPLPVRVPRQLSHPYVPVQPHDVPDIARVGKLPEVLREPANVGLFDAAHRTHDH